MTSESNFQLYRFRFAALAIIFYSASFATAHFWAESRSASASALSLFTVISICSTLLIASFSRWTDLQSTLVLGSFYHLLVTIFLVVSVDQLLNDPSKFQVLKALNEDDNSSLCDVTEKPKRRPKSKDEEVFAQIAERLGGEQQPKAPTRGAHSASDPTKDEVKKSECKYPLAGEPFVHYLYRRLAMSTRGIGQAIHAAQSEMSDTLTAAMAPLPMVKRFFSSLKDTEENVYHLIVLGGVKDQTAVSGALDRLFSEFPTRYSGSSQTVIKLIDRATGRNDRARGLRLFKINLSGSCGTELMASNSAKGLKASVKSAKEHCSHFPDQCAPERMKQAFSVTCIEESDTDSRRQEKVEVEGVTIQMLNVKMKLPSEKHLLEKALARVFVPNFEFNPSFGDVVDIEQLSLSEEKLKSIESKPSLSLLDFQAYNYLNPYDETVAKNPFYKSRLVYATLQTFEKQFAGAFMTSFTKTWRLSW